MGVDFNVVIGHTLSAADLPTLSLRLNADAAPDLARAMENYTQAINRITAEFESTHLHNSSQRDQTQEDSEWRYIEPWYGIYLDAEGNETPPPPMPEMVAGKRYALPGPSALRRASIEEVWSKCDAIEYIGSANLSLDIYRCCCRLVGGLRWYNFLVLPDVQQTSRQVAYEMSRIVGSPCAIYLPDSTFLPASGRNVAWDGGSLDAVIAYLQENCGPPAPTIAAIEAGFDGHSRGDGYFIDDFADLKGTI